MEVECNSCKHYVKLEEYDKHFKKCSAIKYIQKQMKKYYNQDIKYSDLYNLSELEFEKKYQWVLHRVYEATKDKKESKRLENILYGANYSLQDCI